MNPQLDVNFNKLNKEAATLVHPSVKQNVDSTDDNAAGIMAYCKLPYLFLLLPFVFFIIFYFMQPSIFCDKDPHDEQKKILSYKKTMIASIVLAALIVGGYYYVQNRS